VILGVILSVINVGDTTSFKRVNLLMILKIFDFGTPETEFPRVLKFVIVVEN
jgi:hypothetical protein